MGSFYIYRSVLIAQIGIMIGATTFSWSSPVLPKLGGLEDNPLGRIINQTENSWLAALGTLAASIGPIFYGLSALKYGRKTLLISIGLLYVIFHFMMAWAENIWILYIGRFFTGCGMGGVFTIVPIYSGEISDAKHRLIFGTTNAMFVNMGLLIPYCIGPYIPFFWFQITLSIISAMFVLLLLLLVPESPFFLCRKNLTKAENILSKLRGDDEAIQTIRWIKEEMTKEKGSLLDNIKSKGLRRGFFIILGTSLFMHLTGNEVIIAYAQSIFDSVDENLPKGLGPILIGFSQMITAIVMSFVAEKLSRKFLLTISHISISSIQIIFSLYLFFKAKGYELNYTTWLPPTCLVINAILYNVGVGPVFLTLLGELFSTNTKGVAVSLVLVYNFGVAFLLTFLFNIMQDILGIGLLLWLFSFSGVCAIVFIRFFMIETRNKTLQEIQDNLNT